MVSKIPKKLIWFTSISVSVQSHECYNQLSQYQFVFFFISFSLTGRFIINLCCFVIFCWLLLNSCFSDGNIILLHHSVLIVKQTHLKQRKLVYFCDINGFLIYDHCDTETSYFRLLTTIMRTINLKRRGYIRW